MVSGRLKDIVYKKLCEELSHVEIINHKDEIWFIDRDKKYWYFIYDKCNGELWWRYSLFTPFCLLFSLPITQFTIIISSWVEEVLNHKVSTIGSLNNYLDTEVEEVLTYKVKNTHSLEDLPEEFMGDVLDSNTK